MAVTRRSTARLLLLLATATGLLSMHTLGHLRHSGTHAAAPAMVTATMASMDTAGVVAGDIGGPSAAPGHAPGMPMDPTTICLAVLGVAGLVALTLLLLRGRPYGYARRGTTTGRRWLSGRAPPTAIGLRVADLSVMRN